MIYCNVSNTWTNTYNERWALYEIDTMQSKLDDGAATGGSTAHDGATRKKIVGKTTTEDGASVGNEQPPSDAAGIKGKPSEVIGRGAVGEQPTKKAKPSAGNDNPADEAATPRRCRPTWYGMTLGSMSYSNE